MNTIPMTTNSLAPIAECWLYQKGYKYMVNGKNAPSLPKVEMEYTSLLDELKIPYRLDAAGTSCEIWDPECYKEKNETLPVYIKKADGYRMVRRCTGTIITRDSLDAALSLYDTLVKPKIEQFEEEKKMRQLADFMQNALDGKPACGVERSEVSSSELANSLREEIDVVHGDAHFKAFPVYLLRRSTTCFSSRIDTKYVAIFDMSKMSVAAKVEMLVPESSEPIFIGRQGWQVKEWCEKLGGLLKIDVKAAV